MCIYASKIILWDSVEWTVQAKGMDAPFMVVQAAAKDDIQDSLFITVLNKTIPMMEVNYKLNHGGNTYTHVFKVALNRLLNFDYEDPKSLFKAQFAILNEIENGVIHVNDDHRNEDIDTREIHFVGDEQHHDGISSEGVGENQTGGNEIPTASENIGSEQPKTSSVEPKNSIESLEVVSSPIQAPAKVKFDLKKPVIFIYHTHGTESYRPETVGNYHSLNRQYTVRKIGEQLTEHLTKKGYGVIHNETIHDHPSFQGSYARSLETLNENLKKQDSLKLVFDIHRDGIDKIESLPNYNALKEDSIVMINGERVAKLMFVVGGQNENYDKLLKFAEYIRLRGEEMYPGLMKRTIVKDYAKFNQYKSDFSLLIEIGSNANHIDEAVRTTKYLAEILDSVIKDIQE